MKWLLTAALAAMLLCLPVCAAESTPPPIPPLGEMPAGDGGLPFYDFTIDDTGFIEEEADFPWPGTLAVLKVDFQKRFETEMRAELGDNFDELFLPSEPLPEAVFDWAVVEDFDGDGAWEAFVVFASTSEHMLLPTNCLYYVSSEQSFQTLAYMPYFEYHGTISYPRQKQIACASSYGTGLSYNASIYGVRDGQAEFLLSTGTSRFQKDGCFLLTSPRVGCAYEVTGLYYYWDAWAQVYRQLPPLPIEPSLFLERYAPENFTDYIREELKEDSWVTPEMVTEPTDVSTLGGRVFFLSFAAQGEASPLRVIYLWGRTEEESGVFAAYPFSVAIESAGLSAWRGGQSYPRLDFYDTLEGAWYQNGKVWEKQVPSGVSE